MDITTTAIAIYKAIGIPAIHFYYSSIGDGYFKEIHSFPMYYNSLDYRWYNFEKGGNIIHPWARGSRHLEVLYYINTPQIGSLWQMNKPEIMGNILYLSSRAKHFIVSEREWGNINANGYSGDDFRRILLE